MSVFRRPPIESHAALLEALKESLGYCTCAYDGTLSMLRDFLRLVVERTDGVGNSETFRGATEKITTFLHANGSPAMQSWFVYTLDRADMIMHNFNLYDVLIMDYGRSILDALERFPVPLPVSEEDA